MLSSYHLSPTQTVRHLNRPVFLVFLVLLITAVLLGGVVGPTPTTHASALADKGGGGHNPPGPPPGNQPPGPPPGNQPPGPPPTQVPRPTQVPPGPPPTHEPKPTQVPPGPPPTQVPRPTNTPEPTHQPPPTHVPPTQVPPPAQTPGPATGCQFAILSFRECLTPGGCVNYDVPIKNEGSTPVVIHGYVQIQGRANRVIATQDLPNTTIAPEGITMVSGQICGAVNPNDGPFQLVVRAEGIDRACDAKTKQQPVQECAGVATNTPQPTATRQPTNTPRPTATREATRTPAPQPTETREATRTPAPTATRPATHTPRPTETRAATRTPAPTATRQATRTAAATATNTVVAPPANSPTATATAGSGGGRVAPPAPGSGGGSVGSIVVPPGAVESAAPPAAHASVQGLTVRRPAPAATNGQPVNQALPLVGVADNLVNQVLPLTGLPNKETFWAVLLALAGLGIGTGVVFRMRTAQRQP